MGSNSQPQDQEWHAPQAEPARHPGFILFFKKHLLVAFYNVIFTTVIVPILQMRETEAPERSSHLPKLHSQEPIIHIPDPIFLSMLGRFKTFQIMKLSNFMETLKEKKSQFKRVL